MNNINLITSVLGEDYVVANKSKGEIVYHCPVCSRNGLKCSDRKLYVNIYSLLYNCKRCGCSGSLKNLVPDSDILSDNAKDYLKNYCNTDNTENTIFKIPNSLLSDYKDSLAYDYMISRGFNESDMIKYSIRISGINDNPKLLGRVTIPNRVIYTNYTDMYSARSYINSKLRYYNPPNSRKSEILFNIHNIRNDPDYIILNEGVLNSIIAGDFSVASYGKTLSACQFFLIKNLNPKKIYISYDEDANEYSELLCEKFLLYTNIIPYKVNLKEGLDAVDLGRDKYMEVVFNTPKYNKYNKFLKYF